MVLGVAGFEIATIIFQLIIFLVLIAIPIGIVVIFSKMVKRLKNIEEKIERLTDKENE